MKKIIGIICSVLLCGTIFTSFSPSLDGRAVVAEKDVLPQGLFARAFGYLPGDSINVTSLSSKNSVDILVIGAIPAEEGIAILLSPEAAAELGISKNSNNVVKITKRTGQLDEAVAGTAVIGTRNEVTDSYKNEDDEEVEYVSETTSPSDALFAGEMPSDKTVSVNDDEALASEAVEEDDIEYAVVEENPKETVAEEAYDEDAEVAVIEPEEQEEVTVITATTEPEAIEEEKTPVPLEYTVIDGEDVIASEYVEPDDLDSIDKKSEVVAEPFDEELNETGAYDKVDSYLEEGDEIAAAYEELPGDELSESYEPIVLVPADANPPVREENAVESETENETVAAVVEEPEVEVKAPVDEEKVPAKKSVSIDLNKYKYDSLSSLEKGKYYVQIAMLGDENNIAATIKKYGKEYPIALVPLSSGKGYQFLIGALNMDEYGTVLNRFKSYGYKDAFLRKIK